MADNIEQVELDEDILHIADVICRLLKSGYIKIGVDIESRYAKAGNGQWNVSKTYAIVGDEYIDLEEGSVNIIDGI